MSRLSIIHRLYLGFGFLCVIIVIWGLLNVWMMDGIQTRITGISDDAFPIQQQAAEIAVISQRLSREVLSLSELSDPEAIEARYQQIQADINTLDGRLDTLARELASVEGGEALQSRMQALRARFDELAQLAERSRALRSSSLAVSEQVLNGLSEFLLQAAEMKQEIIREAQGKAASDIYLSNLVVTLINRFSSVELLLMNLVNTQDPATLTEQVEQIRYNSQNFNEDIADLAFEIPELEGLVAQKDAFLLNINSEEGVVSRYYQYRQSLAEIEQVRAQVSALADTIDQSVTGIMSFSEDFILASGTMLKDAAARSSSLVLVLLPVVVVIGVVVSLVLGRTISRPLRATVDHVVAMAGGDYSRSLDARASGEFAVLTESVNRLVSAMQNVLKDLRLSADELATVSGSNEQVSADVRERMNHQNQELASIATAMVEMETAIHEVSGNTTHSLELTASIESDVAQSQALMQQNLAKVAKLDSQVEKTSDIVDQLATSSKDIGTIILTIEDIAGRTNLLALNAAIEAARAGETGRGFAVVADEVRELASRTTQSTDTIRSLIERLQTDSEQAVSEMDMSRTQLKESRTLIEQASSEIDSVAEAMLDIRNTADQISAAMQEQETVAASVTRNVNDISGAAQENFGQIEAVAANGKRLNALMDRIEGLMKGFRV
ncbi:MAG: methyl-accepting chemotaxis protein [Marinobacter sp.]|uniref:HAMP domain-containing methyl-accepting chemotaxis protein n=1 Tax=Marinobacter sp. TaxID=50741 RepID=UPI00299E110A|nr:methyl-accepting chemotaxis protein [Marinobacter sp.]MDX1634618.1 methyl-accepting chemotaxis protein [Marinobacter sp.]